MSRKCLLVILCVYLCTGFMHANAATNINPPFTEEQKDTKLREMDLRVKEIKAMDKSQLSVIEKRALKAEVKAMKREARGMSNHNLYLTLAGILLVILVLILVL
ncbi:MAG: hypothetical protein J0I41_02125 [Filimonas sp.]|nr:hypothetical protein [Filimonas sp.]